MEEWRNRLLHEFLTAVLDGGGKLHNPAALQIWETGCVLKTVGMLCRGESSLVSAENRTLSPLSSSQRADTILSSLS
jgi:hypothetical protein